MQVQWRGDNDIQPHTAPGMQVQCHISNDTQPNIATMHQACRCSAMETMIHASRGMRLMMLLLTLYTCLSRPDESRLSDSLCALLWSMHSIFETYNKINGWNYWCRVCVVFSFTLWSEYLVSNKITDITEPCNIALETCWTGLVTCSWHSLAKLINAATYSARGMHMMVLSLTKYTRQSPPDKSSSLNFWSRVREMATHSASEYRNACQIFYSRPIIWYWPMHSQTQLCALL